MIPTSRRTGLESTATLNPLMLDVPQQLETERLLLCAPSAGLSSIVQAAIRDSHDSLKQWFAWAKTLPTQAEIETDIRQAIIRFHQREDMRFYLFKKTDGVLAGVSWLTPLDWRVPSFAIGYWINTRFEGEGFITEAVQGLVSFAFQTCAANRLEIRCDSRNRRSIAVAERAAFIYEGIRHHDRRDVDGNLRDTVVYVRFQD